MQHGSTFCFCSKDRDLSSNHVLSLSLSLSLLLPSAHPLSLLFYRSLSVSPVRLAFSSAPPFHFTFPFSFQLLSFPLSTQLLSARRALSRSLSYFVRLFVHSRFRKRHRNQEEEGELEAEVKRHRARWDTHRAHVRTFTCRHNAPDHREELSYKLSLIQRRC